jgi:hypothetical protein
LLSQRRKARKGVIVFLGDLCASARKRLNMLFIPDSSEAPARERIRQKARICNSLLLEQQKKREPGVGQ